MKAEDFKVFSFTTKRFADTFQKYCNQGHLITKRISSHEVSLYIKSAAPCVQRLADKYYNEVTEKK